MKTTNIHLNHTKDLNNFRYWLNHKGYTITTTYPRNLMHFTAYKTGNTINCYLK